MIFSENTIFYMRFMEAYVLEVNNKKTRKICYYTVISYRKVCSFTYNDSPAC